MSPLVIPLVCVGSYLIGSIPAGYFAGLVAGVDIRQQGSGNIGATNVLRTLGKKYGYPVFAFDVLKGFLAVTVAPWIAHHLGDENHDEWLRILGAISGVVGHSYPVWLRFKGGKGVATSAGILLALVPVAAVVAATIWTLTFLSTRYVSIASIAAAVTLPIAVEVCIRIMNSPERLPFYLSIALSVVVLIRHRSNFSRLMHGTEQRFTRSEDQ